MMKHITTRCGTSYIRTFPNDEGNDLGLDVSSLYYYDTLTSKYVESHRDLVDVIYDMVEMHDIPKSRVEEG